MLSKPFLLKLADKYNDIYFQCQYFCLKISIFRCFLHKRCFKLKAKRANSVYIFRPARNTASHAAPRADAKLSCYRNDNVNTLPDASVRVRVVVPSGEFAVIVYGFITAETNAGMLVSES